jgi:hypothetical protein
VLRRVVAAFLWFLAAWVGYEIVWSMTDVPRMLGPLLAGGVAAIVAVDPLRLFWPVQTGRQSDKPSEVAISFDSSMTAPR